MPFGVTTVAAPGKLTLRLRGDFDYGGGSTFLAARERVLAEQPAACVLDLSEVEFLDSTGLGLMLSLAKEYSETGGKLVLVPSEPVSRVLELTRLDGVFTIGEG